MDGCIPCTCGSVRLIPDVWMGEPTVIKIRCIDCDMTVEEAKETSSEAVLEWNTKIVSMRYR